MRFKVCLAQSQQGKRVSEKVFALRTPSIGVGVFSHNLIIAMLFSIKEEMTKCFLLPYELWEKLLDDLDRESLVSLQRSCHFLKEIVVTYIYSGRLGNRALVIKKFTTIISASLLIRVSYILLHKILTRDRKGNKLEQKIAHKVSAIK